MTKVQMQEWVGLNCKFAASDRFANKVIAKIIEAKIEVSGDVFLKIVSAILKEKIATLHPDLRNKLFENLSKQVNVRQKQEQTKLTKFDMMNELKTIINQLGLQKSILFDKDTEGVIEEVLMNERLKDPKSGVQSKGTKETEWEASQELGRNELGKPLSRQPANIAPKQPITTIKRHTFKP